MGATGANELRITIMTLPESLEAAIAQWLERHGSGSRRAGTSSLSETYRGGGTSQGIDLAAYLVSRLPATFAAVSRVLDQVRVQRPDFAPESVLDVGSGPGTASWAAVESWHGITGVSFLDNAPPFLALAGELAEQGPGALAQARRVAGSLVTMPKNLRADLVIAAYTLAELPLARMAEASVRLWQASTAMLVIVEPGTPQGFARIRAVRDTLLKQGAVPVAPCPHAAACPVSGSDWCHFSVRLARSRAHMHAKGASVPFEDEKFSYLVLAREGAPSGGGRILSPAAHAKPGVTFRLCTQGRIENRHVARRAAQAYKRMRKLDWGDLIGPASEDVT